MTKAISSPVRPAGRAKPPAIASLGGTLLNGDALERREIRQLLDEVAQLTAALRSAPGAFEQALVDRTPIRRHDPVAQRLKQRAADAILSGTAWLTSREVGVRADPEAANPHSLPSRWLSQGRIFAIEHRGQKVFPDYAFDLLGQPIAELRVVLKLLDGHSPLRIASWFESSSSCLEGRKPRELLATQPSAVIETARAHLAGPQHG
jgi:hypothetical protein